MVAQCNVILCKPVDSPELRKARDKSSTSSRLNTIVSNYEEKGSSIATTPLSTTSYFPSSSYESSSTFQTSPHTFQPSISSSFKPISTFMPSLLFQQNQLIKGQNSVYGSNSPMNPGGLVFAINGNGVTTTPVMPGGMYSFQRRCKLMF